ncbi:MAG: hypothetical protein KBD06_01410 [Candidatus Pacebacteria bacterium]|nr:hypothetical protein [Candidatus Paceibacterota bacterium]
MHSIQEPRSGSALLRYAIATPVTFFMVIPLVILDVFLELYHRVCFPLYGMAYVKRSQYIRITDRAKLPYLTWYEKINCAYCGYANGLLHYASVIAGKTESYWCAIAHLEERGYVATEHENFFAKYGDEASLRRRYFLHEKEFGSMMQERNDQSNT